MLGGQLIVVSTLLPEIQQHPGFLKVNPREVPQTAHNLAIVWLLFLLEYAYITAR